MPFTKTYDLIMTFKNDKAIKSKHSDSYQNKKRPHTSIFEDFDSILFAVCRETDSGVDEAPTLLYYINFFFQWIFLVNYYFGGMHGPCFCLLHNGQENMKGIHKLELIGSIIGYSFLPIRKFAWELNNFKKLFLAKIKYCKYWTVCLCK